MRRPQILLGVLILCAAACTGAQVEDSVEAEAGSSQSPPTTVSVAQQQEDRVGPRSFAGTQLAPEFPVGLEWLNTGRELTLEELRGKAVLLDFWTYGCINCIHIIPDLERLEREYPDELVIIGVHSAKFLNEGETENIRQIVLRYGLEHPVVNDRDFKVWQMWGAQAWPTVVLVDPAGNVVGTHAGEGVYAIVKPVLEELISDFDERSEIDRSPLDFRLEIDGLPNTVLSFPGKVATDPTASRLFIADTGHHRIIVADPQTGDVLDVFGSGTAGFEDGAGLEATFSSPQGIALDGDVLYVADTDNHAIRRIDLVGGQVTTLAGTGMLRWPPTGGAASNVSLNSPWDLTLRQGVLYVAMAGFHQIWSLDLASGIAAPIVGNGRESTINGPLAQAELAQPSGVAFDDDGRLYFADSESSAVRYADVLDSAGLTGVVAGSDQHLFDFGDVDGTGTEARLQHPLGVAYDSGADALLVADTYNSKIKRIDLATGVVTTYLGDGQGWADGAAPLFYEPGGLAVAESTLFVADTNNHAVRIVDLATGETRTLVLKGIDAFEPAPEAAGYRGTIVELDQVTIASGDSTFVLDIVLPPDHKVNEDAPSSVVWSVDEAAVTLSEGAERSLTGTTFPVSIDAVLHPGATTALADLTVIYCREDATSLCFIQQLRFVAPLVIEDGAAQTSILLSYEVERPDL